MQRVDAKGGCKGWMQMADARGRMQMADAREPLEKNNVSTLCIRSLHPLSASALHGGCGGLPPGVVGGAAPYEQ